MATTTTTPTTGATTTAPISPLVDGTIDASNGSVAAAENTTLDWASEWLGYVALCMFSMVLLIPTLGIVGLMVWEYFTDEAERKAERQKEIEQAMHSHFNPKKEGEEEDDIPSSDSDAELRDVDEVLKQAETMLHKRRRPQRKTQDTALLADDFDDILT